jgi:hypothetical protein
MKEGDKQEDPAEKRYNGLHRLHVMHELAVDEEVFLLGIRK